MFGYFLISPLFHSLHKLLFFLEGFEAFLFFFGGQFRLPFGKSGRQQTLNNILLLDFQYQYRIRMVSSLDEIGGLVFIRRKTV